jgi:hypothetical protein
MLRAKGVSDMPFITNRSDIDPCILEGIQPLLSELKTSICMEVVDADHPDRAEVEAFIYQVFARHYRADVRSFCPTLISFHDHTGRRAVVGLRDACAGRLFPEQYLPGPAQQVISHHLGIAVERSDIVEVGNMALESSGDARWVIAAVTLFLHAQGYRWVLFTAIRALINAFQRLGLQPVQLIAAQPMMLVDHGRQWGDYYKTGPIVCAGNIESGYQKLHSHIGHHQPMLRALFSEVRRRGEAFDGKNPSRCGGE